MLEKCSLELLSPFQSLGPSKAFRLILNLINCRKISTILSQFWKKQCRACRCWVLRESTRFSTDRRVLPPMTPIILAWRRRWIMFGWLPASILLAFNQPAVRGRLWRNGWKTVKNLLISGMSTSVGCNRFRETNIICLNAQRKRLAYFMPITSLICKKRQLAVYGARRFITISRKTVRSLANWLGGRGPIGLPTLGKILAMPIAGSDKTSLTMWQPNTRRCAATLGFMICPHSAKFAWKGRMPVRS